MAMVQTMLSSFFSKNAADEEVDLKKGLKKNVSVAWFFAAAIGASVALRALDKFFDDGEAAFSASFEYGEAMHNALCAFGAFAAGIVISEVFGMGCVSRTAPATKIVETDSKPQAPPRRAAAFSASQPPLSEADSTLVSDIVDAGHKGSFDVAEKCLQELVQSLSGPGDFDDDLPTKGAGMRPERAAHSLIEVCIHAGDVQRASAWLEALHGCGLSCAPRTLRWVLSELSNGASTKEAEQLFSRMLAAGAEMDDLCYQLLFERLADGDAAVEAYLARLQKKGSSEWVTGYVALIRTAAASGERERAEHWLKHCVANVAKGPNRGLAGAGSADLSWSSETTEHWLRQTLEAGAQADEVDYASVIDAWAKTSEGAGALRLMELMRA